MKPEHTGRCFGYIRVSSDDQAQNGVSLLEQEKRIAERYARVEQPNGYNTFRLYRDDGVSAFKKNMSERPQGSRLLNTVRGGDTVIFASLDRAFRNIADGQLTLTWFKEKNIRVVILNMGGEAVDSSTIMGLVVVTNYLLIAQVESMQRGIRVQAAHDYNYKTRGFASVCLPGFRSYRTNGGALAQKIDWDYIDNAEACLLVWWNEGIDSLAKRLRAREIWLVKKQMNRKTGLSYCTGDKLATTRSIMQALHALYFTGRLKAFCELHGRKMEDYIDPPNKRIRSPRTGTWWTIKNWPKGIPLPMQDVLDDTGRPTERTPPPTIPRRGNRGHNRFKRMQQSLRDRGPEIRWPGVTGNVGASDGSVDAE